MKKFVRQIELAQVRDESIYFLVIQPVEMDANSSSTLSNRSSADNLECNIKNDKEISVTASTPSTSLIIFMSGQTMFVYVYADQYEISISSQDRKPIKTKYNPYFEPRA